MLAVAGGKGGVGRTTTALALATAAARVGYEPVVVETDRDCPNLATRAGSGGDGLDKLASGYSLTAAATSIEDALVVGATGRIDDHVVERALDRIVECDRPVMLDCPGGGGRPATEPLRYAQRTLLVTRRTRQAVSATEKTAAMARRLDAPPVGVIVTGTTRPGRVSAQFEELPVTTVPRVERPAWRTARPHYEKLWARLAG